MAPQAFCFVKEGPKPLNCLLPARAHQGVASVTSQLNYVAPEHPIRFLEVFNVKLRWV